MIGGARVIGRGAVGEIVKWAFEQRSIEARGAVGSVEPHGVVAQRVAAAGVEHTAA